MRLSIHPLAPSFELLVHIVWSRSLPVIPASLSLAREPGTALVWDAENHLVRVDRLGKIIVRRPAPASLAATCSEDGGIVAAIGKSRASVDDDLGVGFALGMHVAAPASGPVLEHLGRQLAVSDEAGGVLVFDTAGKVVWQATAARPLLYLAFVPEANVLVGSADFGMVASTVEKRSTGKYYVLLATFTQVGMNLVILSMRLFSAAASLASPASSLCCLSSLPRDSETR